MDQVRRQQRHLHHRHPFTAEQREVFEALRNLQRAWIALEDKEARLILAARREGLSNHQVAIGLGISPSAVKHRYGAAKRAHQNGATNVEHVD